MDKENEEQPVRQATLERFVANNINMDFCGEVKAMKKDYAEVELISSENMEIENGVAHTGFIFASASFAAICAINKKNALIIGSNVKFLAPVETNQKVIFKAKTTQGNIRKCEVKVEGYILDIKIFDGLFYIVIFDKKLFKLKLKDDKEL